MRASVLLIVTALVQHETPPVPEGYHAGSGAIRITGDTKDAEVFVDGDYVGIVDDFDGTFQKLYLEPGEHIIELRLEGHRTFTERVRVIPNRTQKLHLQMVPLGPGETRAGPPAAAKPVEPPRPEAGAPSPPPPTPKGIVTSVELGVLRLRVQPADGEIRIDGEPWGALAGIEELSIHLPAGLHRIELVRAGSAVLATDVSILPGETTPLNIRLAH